LFVLRFEDADFVAATVVAFSFSRWWPKRSSAICM